MERQILMIVLLFLVTSLMVTRNEADCSLDEVTLTQEYLGSDPDHGEAYGITVTNQCPCKLVDVFLSPCGVFKPYSTVPPNILTQNFKLNANINAGGSATFIYTAEKQWPDLEVAFAGCFEARP